MDVKAEVKNITKLKDYFFLVPDYQREYVWKVDDQVEQFWSDIDGEYEPGASNQSSYFIGSIIIVKNGSKYDVIDGQQRLTTIVLTMCAFRDLLKAQELSNKQKQYYQSIETWLSNFDIESNESQVRLELQYDESKDFLARLIQGQAYQDEATSSIEKMQLAFDQIKAHLEEYLKNGVENLTEFARYFLTKIDLVVIESENLSSALKIFETINQRGAGLNAMDLVKNLLFSEAKPSDFVKIKEKWKSISSHLQRCDEDQSPLRFLRYFLMARYHNGILREDDIYKWIISADGKKALGYELKPMEFVIELEKQAKRYADLIQATSLMGDGGTFPAITNIGFINKYKSRQHLVLLLALDSNCPIASISYLGSQLESFFFFSNTLGIQAKDNERQFAKWAVSLRGLSDEENISKVVDATIFPYIREKLGEFRQQFMNLRHSAYSPQYRLRFVLSRVENTLRAKCNLPLQGHDFVRELQVEHILPQTPKDGVIPECYAKDVDDYQNAVHQLGNVTLLESTINQAVNNFNDLNGKWFPQKQCEYSKSNLLTTNLLDHQFSIGKNTAINRVKAEYKYSFDRWDKTTIKARQEIMLELAFETWKINGKRIDQDAFDVASSVTVAEGKD
jgi:uncharacterized protein with ParB-like and HNH nuclease domain